MQSGLAIQIDTQSLTPVYRQIANSLRLFLVSGDLSPGDFLPPVRQLAVDLAVHFNTVAEAYRILADEGWLDLKRRRGAQVLDRPLPSAARPGAEEEFSQRLRESIAAARADGVSTKSIARRLRENLELLDKC